jgi:hypothetical protein
MRASPEAKLARQYLEQAAPRTVALMDKLLAQQPFTRYKGDVGEIRARVAGSTAGMPTPSSSTLKAVYDMERSGTTPNFTIQTPNGGMAVLPQQLLLSGELLPRMGPPGSPMTLHDRAGTLIGTFAGNGIPR